MEEKELFKFDMQLFAGEGEGEGTTNGTGKGEATGNTGTEKSGEKTSQKKEYTQEEIDKIVNDRLSREKNKFSKQLEEEKRLAKLTAEEQEKERFKKEKEEFEAEKKAIAKEKMTIEIAKQLSAEKLPASFANRLLAETAEEVKENITQFKAEWNAALNAAVEERIKGKTPQGGQTATTEEEQLKASIRAAAGLK